MFTRPNPIILFLLIEQFMFIETFFIAENEELMLVPSVAFRYHPLDMSLDGKAGSTDDWILYAQGIPPSMLFDGRSKSIRLLFC